MTMRRDLQVMEEISKSKQRLATTKNGIVELNFEIEKLTTRADAMANNAELYDLQTAQEDEKLSNQLQAEKRKECLLKDMNICQHSLTIWSRHTEALNGLDNLIKCLLDAAQGCDRVQVSLAGSKLLGDLAKCDHHKYRANQEGAFDWRLKGASGDPNSR